jgi:ABC-type polysaccharide/polyol phosphate export permease
MAVYGDVVRNRELFASLFRRDFQAKYRGSVLGVAWSLVNPLALMVVYLVVFEVLNRLGARAPHYALYLLTGIACWTFFGLTLQSASRSMVASSDLIRKVKFPRQLVALSVVATQAVTFAVMFVLLVVLSLVFVPGAASRVWLAIPMALLFVGLVAGCALIVACLNVLFRDVEHILTAALLPWFFLTPILWGTGSLLPSSAQHHRLLIDVLVWGNFVAPAIEAIRDPIWLGHAPRPSDVVYLAVSAVVALALGAVVFARIDDRLAIEL